MTIEEAIRNLTTMLHTTEPVSGRDRRTAMKLSLEALRKVESQRRLEGGVAPTLLPSETY